MVKVVRAMRRLLSTDNIQWNDTIDFKDDLVGIKLSSLRFNKFENSEAKKELLDQYDGFSLGDIILLLLAANDENKDMEGSTFQSLLKEISNGR